MNSPVFPSSDQLSSAKILIVDDEAAHIRLLEWALRQAKFENFRSVSDSTKALEEFREFQPDIVLLDLNMPQLDGFAVLQQLREVVAGDDFVPVLMLTGENTAEIRTRALAGGANDFLGKPLDYSEVMLRIRNLLQTRLLYRESRELRRQVDALRQNGSKPAKSKKTG